MKDNQRAEEWKEQLGYNRATIMESIVTLKEEIDLLSFKITLLKGLSKRLSDNLLKRCAAQKVCFEKERDNKYSDKSEFEAEVKFQDKMIEDLNCFLSNYDKFSSFDEFQKRQNEVYMDEQGMKKAD